jgi:hypothetical protein
MGFMDRQHTWERQEMNILVGKYEGRPKTRTDLCGVKNFLHIAQHRLRASYPMGTRGSFPGGKAAGARN